MIPIAVLQSVIEEKENELARLKFHCQYPELSRDSVDRWELFQNLERKIKFVTSELHELEEVLTFVNEANENERER